MQTLVPAPPLSSLLRKDKEQAALQPGPEELSKGPTDICYLFPQALAHNVFMTIIAFYSLGCKSILALHPVTHSQPVLTFKIFNFCRLPSNSLGVAKAPRRFLILKQVCETEPVLRGHVFQVI